MTIQPAETQQTEPDQETETPHWTADHARRYLEARYGENVWFRAPETFTNTVELWIWCVASGNPEFAEKQIVAIERHLNAMREEPEDAGEQDARGELCLTPTGFASSCAM